MAILVLKLAILVLKLVTLVLKLATLALKLATLLLKLDTLVLKRRIRNEHVSGISFNANRKRAHQRHSTGIKNEHMEDVGDFSHGIAVKKKKGSKRKSESGVEKIGSISKRGKGKAAEDMLQQQHIVLEETHTAASVLKSNMTIDGMINARNELTAEINALGASIT